jgi:cytochrome c-type biogenesis protein CcmH/NrfG
VRIKCGELANAIRLFEDAIVIDPAEPQFRRNLALALENAGQCEETLSQWSVLLGMNAEPSLLKGTPRHIAKHDETERSAFYRPDSDV